MPDLASFPNSRKKRKREELSAAERKELAADRSRANRAKKGVRNAEYYANPKNKAKVRAASRERHAAPTT
jgi:hypothetical protein